MIENLATGERIRFVGIGEDLLVMESEWTRPGHRAPAHVHPAMEERFVVLDGRAAFDVGGERFEAGPGETVTVPPGTCHVAWNAGDEPVRVRLEFRPALRWAEFVERLFAGEDPAALSAQFPREVAAC